MFAGRFCIMNKRVLNVCRTVLHREQMGLERLHGGFARVQKGIEVTSRGFARAQKGLEVGSRGFASCTKGH